ncbi:T9SS type B sorting domain-containing protein [Sediminicola luteus]|nr:T9SS type B sorting domain-containing protein [Sediminicola luteus]
MKPSPNRYLLPLLFVLAFMGLTPIIHAQVGVPFTPRLVDDNIKVKGDLTILSNTILNTRVDRNNYYTDPSYNHPNTPGDNNSFNPNLAYDNMGTNNQNVPMAYIDIDGDASTFSSSSAELNAPTCSRVIYAGLYWGGTYPYNIGHPSDNRGTPIDANRDQPYESVKFKIPGGTYVDIGPGSDPIFEYERIYDENGDTDRDGNTDPGKQEVDLIHTPYLNYANVTHLLQTLGDNPNGEYTIANVVATQERKRGGNLGGWTMVIIYENPNLTSKYISTFDGFAAISNGNSVTFPFSGFRTLPAPLPVNAKIGVSAMEGDGPFVGPQMRFRADSSDPWTVISNSKNPSNNFFNSTITRFDQWVTDKNPASLNNLGWDTDLINLPNPANSVLPNDQTSAEINIRLLNGSGDITYLFLNTMSIDIIEPEVVVEKRVEDIAGNDITGAGVNLGQTLDYILNFQNRGNDDALNYYIRDVLPVNTSFVSADLTGAPGVTMTQNGNDIRFDVPNDLVEEGDPTYTIRLRVQIASNCTDFVDACSTVIENIAYSYYTGTLNTRPITDDPSVSDLSACGLATPGATNFLLDDLSACSFERDVELCGADVILDAGDGFTGYQWVRDLNGNDVVDPTDQVMNDGDPDGDPSTLLVTSPGTYIVSKTVPDPCLDLSEIINVSYFDSNQNNPIVDWFNAQNADADPTNDVQGEIVSCSIDGDLLPKIFLCGVGDSQEIALNFTTNPSVTWERMVPGSCADVGDDCANKNSACNWANVGTGSNYTVNNEGNYRVILTYANGCTSRYYFNAFQNNLNIDYTSQDIYCTTDGNITITNLGAGYAFQLVDITNNAILIPFQTGAGANSFDINTNGAYRVDVTQTDGSGTPIADACIFSTPDIGILNRQLQVDLVTTQATCNIGGAIAVQANNVRANYNYELYSIDPITSTRTLVDDETAQVDNNYTFNNLNPGQYEVVTTTQDGCSDTSVIDVTRVPDVTLSAVTTQDIGCNDGIITLTAGGGFANPNYFFAIWSKDGVSPYTTIADIPAAEYRITTNFQIAPGEGGDYVFVAVDANNCFALSNEVTINDNGTLNLDPTTINNPIGCTGTNSASITINHTGGLAPFAYSIDNGTTYQPNATFANLGAGTYTIRVTDASGCDVTDTITLTDPNPFTASAGISRDGTCTPNGASTVRFTNVEGGTLPYEFSFDGVNFSATRETELLPGNYVLTARDAGGCQIDIPLTVEGAPPVPVITPIIGYNCDGTGRVVLNNDQPTYDFTYEINGTTNTPPTSNTFDNLAPGNYTMTTRFTPTLPPTPSVLLADDFGSGPTIPNPYTNGYFYEPQIYDGIWSGSPHDSGHGNNRSVNDLEYTVTSSIVAPFGAWLNPSDHSTNGADPNGRYLVINVGNPNPGRAIYIKEIVDVIPNQNLRISFSAINLLRSWSGAADPNLTIEVRTPRAKNPDGSYATDGSGNQIIGTIVGTPVQTGNIPNNENWIDFEINIDPGANTELDFLIRTNQTAIGGNDIAIDDLLVEQLPEVCERTVDTPVTIEAGREFTTQITGFTNLSCNGANDGTITFQANNFDPVNGYYWRIDGGTWNNSTTASVTTPANLAAGNHSIEVQYAVNGLNGATADECPFTLNQNLTEPAALTLNAGINTPLTCSNGGAIIRVNSVLGGTAPYSYQLEDTSGTPIGAYGFVANGNNQIFNGLGAGEYVVRVRDANDCEVTDGSFTITNPVAPAFTVTPSSCYSGGSTASIAVNVTTVPGNGGFQFSLNGGPWITPSPANATNHTFTNLANGDYTIAVRDGFGCSTIDPVTYTINPQLTLSATAENISACAPTTDVNITASGGDGSYTYAMVADGAPAPAVGAFSATNPISVGVAGDYDVYVRDGAGCTAMYDLTVGQDAPIVITETLTHITCNGDSSGNISVSVAGGEAPYTYRFNGGSFTAITNYPNLTAGTYTVDVRDNNGCIVTETYTLTEPAALVAEAALSQNYSCLVDGEITVGGVTPTTGGSGNYQYSINGSPWTAASGTGTHTFTGLTNGNHTVRVRDAADTGCFISLPAITINPLPLRPTLTTSVTYNCDGTGNVDILPNDPSYTYSIDGGTTFQPGNSFSNLAVGTHNIVVNYGSDCTENSTVVIENGRAFDATVTASANIGCNGDTNGSITFEVANFGPNGYQYQINGGGFSAPTTTASTTINGLAAQAHTIEIQYLDATNTPVAGCDISINHTLTEPAALSVTAVETQAYTCLVAGAIYTANAAGGTPGYEYQLEDAANVAVPGFEFGANGGNTTFNLGAGTYYIRVRDQENCTALVAAPIVVVAPSNPVFTATPTACYSGANDAQIVINITSVGPGNGEFDVRIAGGPWMPLGAAVTTHTFGSLANGTYTVEVRDNFACTATQTVTISPLLTASINITDVSCSDGNISVTAAGGNGTLVYAIVPNGTAVVDGDFAAGNNSLTVTNAMAANNYDIYVRDNNGNAGYCEESILNQAINQAVPWEVSAIATDPNCNGGTGSIAINLTRPAAAPLTAADMAQIAPFTYEVQPAGGGAAVAIINSVAADSHNFPVIASGNYDIVVTDANGCVNTFPNVVITNPPALTADVETILPNTCDPASGFRFINVSAGLAGTLEYSPDGGANWYASPDFDNPPFSYTSGNAVMPSVRTVDGSGNTLCRLDMPQYILAFPLDDLDITISAVIVGCNDLQVTVQGNEGTAPYEYTYSEDPTNFNIATATWTNPPKGLADPHVFTGLTPGRTYVFYVRDNNGCVRQSNVNVNTLVSNPIDIVASVDPSCNGANNGSITYTLTEDVAQPNMRWQFYQVGNPVALSTSGIVPFNNTITINNLAPEDYYIVVTQVDGSNVDSCVSGSENSNVNELQPLTATVTATRDISCSQPGLIQVTNINGGGGGYTFELQDTSGTTIVAASGNNPIEVPTTEAGGNYQVVVRDQYGCASADIPVTIDRTNAPTLDAIAIDNCGPNTTVTVTASAGAAPSSAVFQYAMLPNGTAPTATDYVANGGVFTNVAAGNYDFYVIDGNGCSDMTTQQVFESLQATATLNRLLSCDPTTPEAGIDIAILAGSGSYEYEVTAPAGGNTIARTAVPGNTFTYDAAVAGSYDITIYENNGLIAPACQRNFTVIVPALVNPVFTLTHQDVSCNGGSDGQIIITETVNSVSPLTYVLMDTSNTPIAGATQVGNRFVNLPAGTYRIEGTGTNQCVLLPLPEITIGEPAVVSVDPAQITVTPFGCTTGNSAEPAVITVPIAALAGGSGTFTRYEFIDSSSSTIYDGPNNTVNIADLNGGIYTVNVYDDNGCLGTTTVTVNPFIELTIDPVVLTAPISCAGSDAEATLSFTQAIPGVIANIEYGIEGINGTAYPLTAQATGVFPGLDVGHYRAKVRYSQDGVRWCVTETTFEIEDPDTFSVDVATTDAVCFGANGSATFSIVDPIGGYAGNFDWEVFDLANASQATGDQTNTTVNLPAGAYYVIITQTNHPACNNRADFAIAEPAAALSATPVVTQITCTPGNDGVIEISNPVGGWGGYTYFVAPTTAPAPTFPGSFVATSRFDGLSADTYQVWIADSQGCIENLLPNITLIVPPAITANLQVNQANCTELDGEIEVNATTGGQGSNYSYQLQRSDIGAASFSNFRASQPNVVFSGLGNGDYQVVITDQWGCTTTTNSVTLFEEIVPSLTIDKLVDCSANPGGNITVTQTGGSGNFSYAIAPAAGIAQPTPGVFTGLTDGVNYTVTITDTDPANACNKTIAITLDPALNPLPAVNTFSDVSCNGANDGVIEVGVTDNGIGNYTFAIVSGDGSSVGSPILPSSNSNTTASFTGLRGTAAGIAYTIRATAANACYVDIVQVITEPDLMAYAGAPVVTEFGCSVGNTTDNATITVDPAAVSGGSGTYVRYEFRLGATVVQNGTNPVLTVTNTAGGTYDINIYDDAGCSVTTSATVLPFNELLAPTVAIDDRLSCANAGEDITITANESHPASGHTYTFTNINSGTSNATGLFTDLAEGTYVFEVANDITGCVTVVSHTVAPTPDFDIYLENVVEVVCHGDTGSFDIRLDGYAGAFDYNVYDTNNTPINSADDNLETSAVGQTGVVNVTVPAGVYRVEIIQNAYPQCTEESFVTIAGPAAPIVDNTVEIGNAGCTQDQGSFFIEPTGGEAPYTISINQTSGGSHSANSSGMVYAFTFEGLTPGNYDISITDSRGCTDASFSATIADIPPVSITLGAFTNLLDCIGDDNGTVSATALGGFGTLTYQLNRYDAASGSIISTSVPQASPIFNGLTEGNYTITVTDEAGCSAETVTHAIISEPTPMVAQLNRTQALTCANDLEMELTASGGTGPYTWSATGTPGSFVAMDFGNRHVFTGLSHGTYRYYVMDSNGCTAILSNEITEDEIRNLVVDIDTSAATLACSGDATAIISMRASEGMGNYSYSLFSDAARTVAVGPTNTDGRYTDLAAGTYYMRVNSGDCVWEDQLTIAEPTPLDYTEDFNNISCNGANDGSITVTLSGGSGGYQYAISPNLNQFDTVNTFTDLEPGDYTVIAQDVNGCFITREFTITQPETLTLAADAQDEICFGNNDGMIDLTITGGTAPYRTALNSNHEIDFTADQTVYDSLAPGTYVVFVRDANDCEMNMAVTIAPGANLNATVEPVYECNMGSVPTNALNIVLEDTSVAPNVMYAMDSTDPNDLQLLADFTNMPAGDHFLTIAHANGCTRTIDFTVESFEALTLQLENTGINEVTITAGGGNPDYTYYLDDQSEPLESNTFFIGSTDTYTVRVVDQNGCMTTSQIFMEFIDIEIPNFFTPNGDGENDRWVLRNTEVFPDIITIIYDRYGREIYKFGQQDNGWDGFYQTTEMPTGDYWYTIKLNGAEDDREFVGHFTLYR